MSKCFSKKTLDNGADLYVHSTDKFKTTSICIFLHQNLSEIDATKTALLPLVLKRGTKSLPTSRKINLFLENLYGADLGADVLKRGEVQILQFFLNTVDSKFVAGESVLDKALFALKELTFNPLLEGEHFKQSYLSQEKEVLKRNIKSLYSNKMSYSLERCLQEMCKDEPYSIYRYGRVEDIPNIDVKGLYEHYRNCLRHSPADIFVLGNVKTQEIFEKVQAVFDYERGATRAIGTGYLEKEVNKEKFIEDKQDINQGKLNLGFRTNTRYGDDDYHALMVFNGILGGGPHSKLFQNVREKESMAYYAFSRLEKIKGLMIVGAGIEFENYDKAVNIILAQIDDLKQGKISDYEYESAIKSLKNSLKESADNPAMVLSLHLDGILSGIDETALDIISKIEKVTKGDVERVAKKIYLDTVYFLNKNER